MLHLGMPDRFVDHGDPPALVRECGLDARGIITAIQSRFAKRRLEDIAKSVA
jgi:1-deoxy-D-xylulose-5-phosphate synthase